MGLGWGCVWGGFNMTYMLYLQEKNIHSPTIV